MGFRKTISPDDGRTIYEFDSPFERDGKNLVFRISGTEGEAWTIAGSDPELLKGLETTTFRTRPEAMQAVSDWCNNYMEMKADPVELVRRGRFDISGQFLMTFPHNTVFSGNVRIELFKPRPTGLIARAPQNGGNPQQQVVFDCIGVSEYFDEIPEDSEPPKYKIIFSQDDNGYIGMTVEKEKAE